MTENDPKTLDPGVYVVNAACPQCGVIEEILVKIRTVVTIPEDDIGSLRVGLKGKAREHDCRQIRLSVVTDASS